MSQNAVTRYTPPTPVAPISEDEERDLFQTAKALAASGLWKDARQAEEAYAKIIVGRDLGLTAAESMAQLHVIEGKVEASSDLHATRVRERDGFDYEVFWIMQDADGYREVVAAAEEDPLDLRDYVGCAIRFTVGDEQRGVSRWTIEDSERAELTKPRGDRGKTSNHVKYPRSMFFARAMTNGVAWFVPEVMGGLRVYGHGEIQAGATEDDLAAGTGDGVQAGALPSDAFAVVRRATTLGHAGLSNVASASMQLQGATEEQVAQWVANATKTLDAFEARKGGQEPEPEDIADVEVVPYEQRDEAEADYVASSPDHDVAAGAVKAMREKAERLESDAEEARAQGREEEASDLFAEAASLRAEAQAAEGDDPQLPL